MRNISSLAFGSNKHRSINSTAFPAASNVSSEQWKINVYTYALPFLFLLFGASGLANLYILIGVRWIRKRFSPNLLFTTSLTVSDAWVSFIILAGLCINSYLPVVHNHILFGAYAICFSLAFEAIRLGAMVTTIYHLLALASNHYIGIVMPLHHQLKMTRTVALIIIALLWTMPPLILFIFFGTAADQAFRSSRCQNVRFYSQLEFRLVVTILIFAPLILLSTMYTHIFFIILSAKKRRRLTLGSISQAPNPENNAVNAQRNYKAVKTTSLVVGTYVLGWIPAVVVYILFCNNCYFTVVDHKVLVFWLSLVTNALLGFKCLVNPLIYAVRVGDLKKALISMSSCLPRKCQTATGSYGGEHNNTSLLWYNCGGHRSSCSTPTSKGRERHLSVASMSSPANVILKKSSAEADSVFNFHANTAAFKQRSRSKSPERNGHGLHVRRFVSANGTPVIRKPEARAVAANEDFPDINANHA